MTLAALDDGPPETTIRAVPDPDPFDDGPPTVGFDELDAPDDHEARPTEQIAAVLPQHDHVANAPGRTGFGSARTPPRTYASRLSIAAAASRRRHRLAFRILVAVLVTACIAMTAVAAWFGFLGWAIGADPTPVPLRTVSPLLTIAAVALLVAVLAIALLMLAVRR